MICLFDTETTGLLLPKGAPLANQPRIIEFAAIKCDNKLKEISRMDFIVNPGIPLPAIITKITGLTDVDVVKKPTFSEYVDQIVEFFSDVNTLIAHNINFDIGMFKNDMRRAESYHRLDWGFRRICTVEATLHINNKRMKLEKAYRHFVGKDPKVSHRAMGDVESLLELTKCLVDKDIIILEKQL